MTTKKPTRRQRHAYNRRLVDLICERIAVDGVALREICQDTSMPARSTLFIWLRRHPEFARKYTFAKQFQIQGLADDMIDIADDCSKDWIEREGPDGKKFRVFDHEYFRRSKRQMGALQWRISKLRPQKIPLDVACYPSVGSWKCSRAIRGQDGDRGAMKHNVPVSQ